MVTAEQARRTFQVVVAATRQWGIGKGGTLPWHLPGDMKYFKELTSKTADPSKRNAVIMGRRTWESIPPKFRPLPGRINIVLSRSASGDENAPAAGNAVSPVAPIAGDDVHVATSLDQALALLCRPDLESRVENVFVIGGGQVYKDSMASPRLSAIHLTLVEADVEDCDTFMPPIDESRFRLWAASPPRRDTPDAPRYSFLCYTRAAEGDGGAAAEAVSPPSLPAGVGVRHEEQQYLDLIEEVMREGAYRGDRTGTGTFAKLGASMRFNLRHSFPLLTTKRVFWRGGLTLT